MLCFYCGLAFILLGGISAVIFNERLKATIYSLLSGIGTFFLLKASAGVLIAGNKISHNLHLSFPIGEVRLIIDPLSAFFIIVISIMSFLGSVYAIGYIKPYLFQRRTTGSHFLFLSIFVVFMLLVVAVQNALAFLIVWEIMSLASFFLIVFENEKKEVFQAALNYLITMHVGVIFLFAGFIILWIKSGSLNFESFKIIFNSGAALSNTLFLLFFIGFGIKAGFIPLHTWLPKAHPAAPSHISGIMSGVMIKIGIYGILRIVTLIGIPSVEISYSMLAISMISAVLGVMYAIAQHDLKKLLAYHSVENIGIIGMGIGIGMLGLSYGNIAMAVLGFSGGLLHILNHSIFKELLFFAAGAVYQKTHTRNIEEMGGLINNMPFTAMFFLKGSLAISGLPPLNGFISELLIYFGMLSGLKAPDTVLCMVCIISIGILAFTGAMAVICFTKVFSVVFLGKPRAANISNVKEAEPAILLPMGILSLFCILIGLFPGSILNLITKPAYFVINKSPVKEITVLRMLNNISFSLFLFIGICAVIYAIKLLLLRRAKTVINKVWNCGYPAGNNRMQYTAASFARGFLVLVKPLINLKFEGNPIKELFPVRGEVKSKSKDIFEIYFIKPALKYINGFFNLFKWIQSGNTQDYILYGLLFLAAAILWLIGIK